MEAVGHKARWNPLPYVLLPLLISILSVVCGLSYNEYINNTLSHVCPYSSFCNHGPALQLRSKTKTPCCMPCSCEKDCYTRGTCCPDFNPRHAVEPSVKCKAAQFTENISWLDYFPIDFSYYYIIDSCPIEYKNSQTVEKCINPRFDRLQDVKDVAIVSNLERIYSNRHCAQCNNEAIFTMWTTVLYNLDQFPNASYLALVPDKYVLKFIPSEVKTAKSSQCFSHFINKCNATGKWDFYDYHLIKACDDNNINSHYIDERYGMVEVFKNAYCFLCNNEKGASLQNKCTSLNDDGRTKGTPSGKLALSLILDPGDWYKTLQAPIHISACASQDEIYDKYFDVCRQLYCPIFNVPIKGQCVSPYQGVADFSISVVFELTIDNEVDLNELDYQTKEQINTKVVQTIGLIDYGCTKCVDELANRKKDDGIATFLLVSYRVSFSCTVQRVLDTFRLLAVHPITFSVQIESKRVTFISQLSYEFSTLFQFRDEVEMPTFHIDIFASNCYSMYVLQDRFCEYIEISIQEYNTLRNSSYPLIQSSEFRLVTNEENGLSVYRVCTDDYFWKQSVNGAGIVSLGLTVFIVALLACMTHM